MHKFLEIWGPLAGIVWAAAAGPALANGAMHGMVPPPAPMPGPAPMVSLPPSTMPPPNMPMVNLPVVANPFATTPAFPDQGWNNQPSLGEMLGFTPPPPPDPSRPLTPMERHPSLAANSDESRWANWVSTAWSGAETTANVADWVGWSVQTGMAYHPATAPIANTLGVVRGAGEGLGRGYANSGGDVMTALEEAANRAAWSAVANGLTMRHADVPGLTQGAIQTAVQSGGGRVVQVTLGAIGAGAVTAQQVVGAQFTDAADEATARAVIPRALPPRPQ